ncbi:MAG: NAD-binding protein [Chloroflexota bacterium]
MRVIILGCGRLGALLGELLDADGHEVTIIDPKPEAFSRLASTFRGSVVVGVGIDEDVLRRAGIEQADAFIALSDGDNTNVMACQIAKYVFHVPKVISQIKDPGRREVFTTLELDNICPTILGADAFKEELLKEA